ncbi:MAG: cysteine--tRNA ligase [Candidatus Micrarchaeota archaeon]
MRVYDSIAKAFVEFKPVESKRVVMYVCGLTPYDQAHIGHARTYVAFDVLKRYLKAAGYEVLHIQNITDVDDKIINRCKQSGAQPKQLTESNHTEALVMFDKLNIQRATVYPKVTEHIPEIIEFIKKIIKNGYAYETATGVYFDVSKFANYGRLSGQKMDEIHAGSRKDVDETKDDPADFALWKKTNGEIIEFDSPWGRGRPGWHIECSAMAGKYAKRTLDIHGGARDLIFPHHENEIAQSEAATGKQFSKYWLHTGFLTVGGEKMSKPLGNFTTIKDALQQFSPMAMRIFYLKSHYRSPVDYDKKNIAEAGQVYEHIANTLQLVDEALAEKKDKGSFNYTDAVKEFHDAMENDFDTPLALAALFRLMKELNIEISKDAIDKKAVAAAKAEMQKMLDILGITIETKGLKDRDDIVQLAAKFGVKAAKPEEAIEKLIEAREEARNQKNYKLSDEIRTELKAVGIVLEDKKGGQRWRVE